MDNAAPVPDLTKLNSPVNTPRGAEAFKSGLKTMISGSDGFSFNGLSLKFCRKTLRLFRSRLNLVKPLLGLGSKTMGEFRISL